MQILALTSTNELIHVHQAQKQTDYICLECHDLVRARGGLYRQNHFYHLSPNESCRQSGKSLEHLQTQYFIQALLGKHLITLEKRFTSINRVADVVWEEQKLIFEIQCSPIAMREVYQRNQDYSKLGYQVIWILHDSQFNHKRLTAAELYLQTSSHYFTNIDIHGKGLIYDQSQEIQDNHRKIFHSPYLIDLKNPFIYPKISHPPLYYRNQWKIGFQGDVIAEESKNRDLTKKLSPSPSSFPLRSLIYNFIFKPLKSIYRLIFHWILENACQK